MPDFILEFCPKGELFEALREHGTLDLTSGRFVLAEIAVALRHIHGKHILHRDLKPENMLIGADSHIRITDFGTAAKVEPGGGADGGRLALTHQYGGTRSVELPSMSHPRCCRIKAPHLRAFREAVMLSLTLSRSDLWAYGCVLFQVFAGRPPFRGESEYLTFQLILDGTYSFPEWFPADAKDLVASILVRCTGLPVFVDLRQVVQPDKRLGAGPDGTVDWSKIMTHPFFHGVRMGLCPPLTAGRSTSTRCPASAQQTGAARW